MPGDPTTSARKASIERSHPSTIDMDFEHEGWQFIGSTTDTCSERDAERLASTGARDTMRDMGKQNEPPAASTLDPNPTWQQGAGGQKSLERDGGPSVDPTPHTYDLEELELEVHRSSALFELRNSRPPTGAVLGSLHSTLWCRGRVERILPSRDVMRMAMVRVPYAVSKSSL